MGTAKVLPTRARALHTWQIGLPGMGKSKTIEACAIQDIAAGRGGMVIDLHEDLFRNLRNHVAILSLKYPGILERIVVVDPTHPRWSVGINPLEPIQGMPSGRQAAFMTDIMIKVWRLDTSSSPRMIWLVTNTFQALIEAGLSLLDIQRFLTDSAWRQSQLERTRSASVKRYFTHEFPTTDRAVAQWTAPVLNKLGRLTIDPDIRPIFAGTATISFRKIMDEGAFVLVNLPKGRIGEAASSLIAGFLVALMQKAALSRADTPHRRTFYVYLDEFQDYTTDNIQDILAESRKYGVTLTLAHQFLDQLSSELRSAVSNICGTNIIFRVGYNDAAKLVKDIFPGPDFFFKVRKERLPDLLRGEVVLPVETDQPIGWEGLALKISNLPRRHFWLKIRGPNPPILLKTPQLPDPVVTPVVLRQVERLYEVSGERFGKLKQQPEVVVPHPAPPAPDEPLEDAPSVRDDDSTVAQDELDSEEDELFFDRRPKP
jgi:hypothetical protein